MSTIDLSIHMTKIIDLIKELNKCKSYQLIKKYKIKKQLSQSISELFRHDMAKILIALSTLKDVIKKSTGISYKSTDIISDGRYTIRINNNGSLISLDTLSMTFNVTEDKYAYSVNSKDPIRSPYIKSRWVSQCDDIKDMIESNLYDLANI